MRLFGNNIDKYIYKNIDKLVALAYTIFRKQYTTIGGMRNG